MRKQDARDVAVSAITAFRKRNAWSDGYLRNSIKANALSKRDAALATEITNGVLQNMLLLNYYIGCFSSVKFNKISPGILDILQVAVYQILFLDKIPDSAAVNDAVSRAKRNNPRAAGFVNAIARKISASKESLPEIKGTTEEILSIKYSHLIWLVRRFVKIYGESETEKILASYNKKADTVVRVNTLKTTEKALLEKETESGVSFGKGIISDSLRVSFSGNIENETAFSEGMFYIQDTASQIAARTLDPQKGAKVLDACSAPGGKSFLMAQLMENNGEITSCDIHKHKIDIISSGADKLGIKIIDARLSDATEFHPEFENAFDYVLSDVPCSGLGIIRKKPDIRYKTEEEISDLPQIQLDILKNTARYVKAGGALLYSTCTVVPEENSDVIKTFLSENDMFYEERDYFDIPRIENEFGITLLPHISETDGFYMCKLRRKI